MFFSLKNLFSRVILLIKLRIKRTRRKSLGSGKMCQTSNLYHGGNKTVVLLGQKLLAVVVLFAGRERNKIFRQNFSDREPKRLGDPV